MHRIFSFSLSQRRGGVQASSFSAQASTRRKLQTLHTLHASLLLCHPATGRKPCWSARFRISASSHPSTMSTVRRLLIAPTPAQRLLFLARPRP